MGWSEVIIIIKKTVSELSKINVFDPKSKNFLQEKVFMNVWLCKLLQSEAS